jgi:hypothetical protein
MMATDALQAIALAGLPPDTLVRRLVALLLRHPDPRHENIAECRECVGRFLKTTRPRRGTFRKLLEATLTEGRRQQLIRDQRRENRLDAALVPVFDLKRARAALKEVRRARARGVEVVLDRRLRVFRVRKGKGWRPVGWKKPSSEDEDE